MKRINPEYRKAVTSQMNLAPFWSLISMKLEGLEWGRSELVVEVSEKHLQPMGILHGGVYASLVDSTSFWAAYSQLDEETGLTTVELKVNYLFPSKEGRLIGQGRCIKMGTSIALAEARVLDSEGRLVSHGTATMMILKGAVPPFHRGLPPKFLDG